MHMVLVAASTSMGMFTDTSSPSDLRWNILGTAHWHLCGDECRYQTTHLRCLRCPEGGGRLLPVYQTLASKGLSPDSATVDGNPQQIKYLRLIWPSITLQRCTIHVQRQGLSWCRRKPKRTDAKHLRRIFLRLSAVQTPSHAQRFIADVVAWEKRFGVAIVQSTDRGWVFSDLFRARSMLLKALPDLFHFVSNPRIPNSTNALEGYFSRLKEHYRYHRGLAVHHRDAYSNGFFI